MDPAPTACLSYDLPKVDQFQMENRPDLRPVADDARTAAARILAADATIYGLPSVYQYAQMYAQAVDRSSPSYTGFSTFLHQREMTTPAFTAFKTPNVDTLYSNAWLDLTDGPARVRIPPMGDRYYTLHFLDMYSNATNLSSRTVGPAGGDFLVAPTSWAGTVPEGVRVFRVATPYMWILMRILVRDDAGDVDVVRDLQDRVEITPTGSTGQGTFVVTTATAVETDWRAFFELLDNTLRANGHPTQEDALVYRFGAIGLGGAEPLDLAALDQATITGMEAGFDDAMAVIVASRSQVGEPVDATGWVTGTAGECGFNYLRRAVLNFVGTGGNVLAEKKFYVAFSSADGQPLDGSRADYVVNFDPPPPVSGHWSLTMYPVSTGLLYPNEIDRYAIAATTPGLDYHADGSLTVYIQHGRPAELSNWLPAPAEPFYLDIRTWEPKPEIRSGAWRPGSIICVDHHQSGRPATVLHR
jgi:hypothetical protein